ncbi:MAG: zinc-finger domain-containing protein [Rickettsiales bacterium]|nr:zinc-finger domain-containing protein [Rickettsiales bacterium]
MPNKKVSTIQTSSGIVSCNGSVNFSNHPTIYLNLKDKHEVICPYCGIKYIYKLNKK